MSRRRAQRQTTEAIETEAHHLQRSFRRRFADGRGHRRAMSLPELRALTVGEMDEWPVFGMGCEFLSHRILQNVIRLCPAAFFLSQAMFKKVALPVDADGFGGPFLPFTDNQLDRLAGRREGNQGVDVIGHEQENMRPPKSLLQAMLDGFKNGRCDVVRGKLVDPARFAFDGDEVNFLLRINPQRNFVRQRFSSWNVHA